MSEDAATTPAPAGLLGDMTALALTANIRSMTVEEVHQRVASICRRHGLQPATPERDRLKACEFVHRLGLAINAAGRPEISTNSVDAALDLLLQDINHRLNVTMHEMKENA